MDRDKALLIMGAESTPEAVANPGRPLGVAAMETFRGMDAHKRYLLWVLLPGGKVVAEATDNLESAKALYSDVGQSDTGMGDLSAAIYGVLWDVGVNPPVRISEWAGAIVVKPTAVKKSGGIPWGWLALLGGAAGVAIIATRK